MAVLPLEIAGLPYRRFSDQIKGLWTVPGICGIRFLVVDGIEFILVAFGIESLDFENLRNVSSSWPAFELNDDVERVADVGLDSAIGQFDAALENAARESRYCLLRGTGVDG